MNRQIEIVGGGLAGLTLGIALRQHGVPVRVWEAGDYPRHRVCGEFISGRGLSVLEELGLAEKLKTKGARVARTAAFFSGQLSSRARSLPQPALCISRFELDEFLADEFRKAGGELKTHSRKTDFGEGVVRATGRRSQGQVKGWRWFGLKVHVRNVSLHADLEMHLIRDGYVGLCRLNGDVVNVCGLFRSRDAVPDLSRTWKCWLMGAEQSALRHRFLRAVFDENSFCSVAGISLQRHSATDLPECSIGDAITMIPPVTGNGMSIALESAAIASDPLEKFSRGTMDWMQTRNMIAELCDQNFRSRLRWATILQRMMMERTAANVLVKFCSRFPGAWPFLFLKTRK